MKLLLSILLIFTMSNSIYAQIGIEPLEGKNMKDNSTLIDQFKASKTIFIYRDSDDIEALEKAIRAVWTITEISFVPYSKMDDLDFNNNSIFSIGGVNTNRMNMGSGMSLDNTHVYLNLWMTIKNKKGITSRASISRIELHPTFVDYTNITRTANVDALDYLYNKGTLKNWTTGFLKNYLKNVNDLLTSESERWLYANVNENKEIKKLKKATLYIPDYALVKFNKFSGDESKRNKEKKVFKSYPYKYEVISTEELSEKILEDTDPFYYLVYIKSSTDKYVTIYNSVTGDIVYSRYKPLSYNFKGSDLKSLMEIIKK